MGEIIFNTSGLGEITDYYQNEFDRKFNDINGKMDGTITELQGTMEGNEATMANKSFDKIKVALGEIEARSAEFRRILWEKLKDSKKLHKEQLENYKKEKIFVFKEELWQI